VINKSRIVRLDCTCDGPRRKPSLEMTADDHRAIGSTPPKVLKDNPKKTLAETMADDALRAYVRKAISAAADMHAYAMSGNARAIALAKSLRDEILNRDVAYLRDIGRLPHEYSDLDPALTFALPAERQGDSS
jgi:hypothetical protein